MEAALDPQMRQQMARFAALMEQLMPMDELRRQYPFLGDDSMTMEQAMEMMRNLQDLDQLEQALQEAMRTGQLDDIDPEQLAELLGDEAKRAWEELDRLRQLLQDAGYVTNDDRMDLTARGIRRIGQKALREVFTHLKRTGWATTKWTFAVPTEMCWGRPSLTSSETLSRWICRPP